MLRSLYKNTSLPAFMVQSVLFKFIIVTQVSLVQLLKKYNLHAYIMETFNICVIMNLNQKYVQKILFLQSTAYIKSGI